MSQEDYDEEFDEEEEWEYFEVEEKEAFKDRVSIWDIIKLVLLFGFFALFFVYFRFWDVFAGWLAFGNENPEIGYSRLIYLTLVLFPVAASFFLVELVKVSKTLFIPKKETADKE
ncbi:MAG: hypothetical protein ACTSXO_09235 [Candidatus Heimdallarchaeota archaeon]|nr:MAG: hypothetical protein DRO63_05795 [Candidatus Gerdarchaeota archaeon]RLI72393.1 MAG: hypothetical protein DRP02_01920 [Candidatus Gerdarchaeota archaeon]